MVTRYIMICKLVLILKLSFAFRCSGSDVYIHLRIPYIYYSCMTYMYLLIRHICSLDLRPWHLCSHVHLSQSSEKTPLFLFCLATADSADVISPVRMRVCLFMFCSELQIKESLDRESKNKAQLLNQNIILKKQMCPKLIYDAKNLKDVIFVIPQFNKHFSEMFNFVPNLVHLC